MRWIDHGTEPSGLSYYATEYTQGWVRYFRERSGPRPSDDHWRLFTSDLRARFSNRCGYCERICDFYAPVGRKEPTVDHFRPLNRFPERAYEWANWIYSCRRCNVDFKRNKWPNPGYVNPCEFEVMGRPEQFFDYDMERGEIKPKDGLSRPARRKALVTIRDLGLNERDLVQFRLDWINDFVETLLQLPVSERGHLADWTINPSNEDSEFIGITAMVVAQLQTAGEI